MKNKECFMFKYSQSRLHDDLYGILRVQSNSVITNSSGPAIFVRYNRVHLCTEMTNFTLKFVRYNRVRYNRVSLYVCYSRVTLVNICVVVILLFGTIQLFRCGRDFFYKVTNEVR